MKKVFILFALTLFTVVSLMAQTVPAGMKYQAVARDANGEVLALKSVGLEIKLLAAGPTGKTAYWEVHQVTTNILGLFTITIGEGKNKAGILQEVPWSSYEIWMNVGLDPEGGENFTTISTTKLLTVPYAFHAGTADNLVTETGSGTEKTAAFWKVDGNVLTNPLYHYVGTRDHLDFIFRTNNIERMRITKDGDVYMKNSLFIGANLDVGNDAHIGRDLDVDRNANVDFDVHIGQDLDVDRNANIDFDVHIGQDLVVDRDAEIGDDLTVKKNVYLNTVGGETLNNGNFTVTNQKSTLLSGLLTVDLATDLNASLNVDGPTNLQSSLSVNNMSPSTLSGTLLVQQDATFNQHLLVDNPALSSTSVTTGGLVVNGGVGIGENLNVGGASAFGGPVNFAGAVSITDATESTNSTTGALVVTGGVGIGKRLNVAGATAVENTTESANSTSGAFKVAGGAGIVKNLNVGGIAKVENTTESTSASTGALNVVGGAGIGKRLNVGGTDESTSSTTGALVVAGGVGIGKKLNVNGVTKIDATASTATSLIVKGNVATSAGVNPTTTAAQHVANFENTSNGNGISIKLGAPIPHNKNNFITFYNSNNGTVGRIEGEDSDENSGDFGRNQEYTDSEAFLITDIAFATLDIVIAGLESVQASVDLAAASSSSTACAGLGACITTPIPSLIVAAIAEVALKIANVASLGGNLVKASAALVVFRNTHKALEGITFASGSEDYAEYLPKLNPDEQFVPGDIVGVKNGFITKNTNDADMIMVVSLKPVVLGGLPPDGNVTGLEKVAFMGQVPTRIMGKVSPGDYILASGFNNGVGMAKSPDRMKSYDYKKILGVAWEGKEDSGLDYVNTAIGLNSNDMVDLYEVQNQEIKALKDQLNNTNAILAKLVPGFAEAANIETNDEVVGHDHADHETVSAPAVTGADQFVSHSSSSEIVYFNIDRQQLEEGLKLAEDNARRVYEKNGLDIMDHPFWNRLNTDPNYKEELFEEIQEELKYSFHTHKAINERIIEKK